MLERADRYRVRRTRRRHSLAGFDRARREAAAGHADFAAVKLEREAIRGSIVGDVELRALDRNRERTAVNRPVAAASRYDRDSRLPRFEQQLGAARTERHDARSALRREERAAPLGEADRQRFVPRRLGELAQAAFRDRIADRKRQVRVASRQPNQGKNCGRRQRRRGEPVAPAAARFASRRARAFRQPPPQARIGRSIERFALSLRELRAQAVEIVARHERPSRRQLESSSYCEAIDSKRSRAR